MKLYCFFISIFVYASFIYASTSDSIMFLLLKSEMENWLTIGASAGIVGKKIRAERTKKIV